MKTTLLTIFILISFIQFSQNLFKGENGKYGFKDKAGNIIIEPVYYSSNGFSEGLAAVKNDGYFENYSFIDSTGKVVFTSHFSICDHYGFKNGFCWFGVYPDDKFILTSDDANWGFINASGKEIIPATYDRVNPFTPEGIAIVNIGGEYKHRQFIGGKWGVIDTTGKEITPLKYDHIERFEDDLALVNIAGKNVKGQIIGGKWGVINSSGIEVIEIKYDKNDIILSPSGGLIKLRVSKSYDAKGKNLLEEEWNCFNSNGNLIPLSNYDRWVILNQGIIAVFSNEKWGLVDDQGNEILTPKYSSISNLTCGNESLELILVTMKTEDATKYGIVNKDGKEIISPIYEEKFHFHNGIARVKLNGKYGYIDTSGKEIIPFIYQSAVCALKDETRVTLDGEEFYIDKNGNRIDQ